MITDTQTQNFRPTLDEALEESYFSPDPHWTATLSRIGMTRISRKAVQNAYWNG